MQQRIALIVLLTFTLTGCNTSAPVNANPQAPQASADLDERLVINVASAEAFIEAIGSDRTIRIAPGEYIISDPADRQMEHVRWDKVFDGLSLTIRNVKNLTIEGVGVGVDRVRLIARPRYSFVLNFENCQATELRNLTLGHAPEKGACVNGVVGAADCTHLRIVNCDLFGCGTEGLTLTRVQHLRFEESIVRDCAYGIMTVSGCSDLSFVRSRFAGNEEYHGFVIEDSKTVVFEACEVQNNHATGPLFEVTSSSGVRFEGGAIRDNITKGLMNRERAIAIVNTTDQSNRFSGAD